MKPTGKNSLADLKLSASSLPTAVFTLAALITLSSGAQAATIIKADNTDSLNLASSWATTVPGSSDIAQWDATVLAANTSALGSNLSWAGIKIVSPGGLVTIDAGNTLTLGTSGIDLSTATQDLTIASGLTLQGKQSWSATAGRTLNVAGTFSRNGAVVDFTNFNSAATLGTLTNDASGILGPWATTGSTTTLQYVSSAGGSISSYAGATVDVGNLASVTDAAVNYSYAGAATLTTSQTGNTLRYTGGATTTALGTNSLTLNGLMNAGNGALTITSTTGNPGLVTGASGELDIISNAQLLTLSTRITGTGKVVYSGAGAITFGTALPGNSNSYSGGTVINSTSLFTIVGAGSWFGTGPVTFNGGSIFFSGNTLANDFTFNGGLATMNNSFVSTLSGAITLAVTTTFQLNTNGNMVISGPVSGLGGLTKTQGTNNGPLQLANANNTYAGPTTVNVGVLQVKSSLYGNDTAQWTPSNISVASGATFALNIGGTSDFSLENAGMMLTNLLTSVNNNGLRAGSIFGLSTANATAPVTFATTLTDSTGTGGGAVGLRKLGANTLELTGTNTYSGRTRIDAGTLSINNIANVGAASSALGAPTTVANGVIYIGHIASSGTLLYTGVGHSTDRTIQIGTNSAAGPVGGDTGGATIQNDGTGALTFSAATFNTQTNAATGIAANRTLTLQGSNGGTISGAILNNLVTGTATGTANIALTKAGAGTWVLGGANSYTRVTTVTDGALVLNHATALPGGIGTTGGTSALTFNGGVIGLGAGDFTRSLAVAGTVSGATFTGNGGWAAYGADRVVNLGGGSATIQWGDASTGLNAKTLILGHSTATHTVDFQNPLSMTTVSRTVQVDNGAALIDAILSSAITGSAGGNLIKTGLGTLALSGFNTYQGTTTISAGSLQIGSGGTTGSLSTASGITNNATLVFNRSDIVTQGTDFASVINGTGAVTQVGSGTLVLSGANTYTGSTTVTGGTLTLAVDDSLADASNLTIGNGTLAAAVTVNDTVGTLDVSAVGATISLGTTATLAFADSSAVDWTGGRLIITGTFVSGSSLRFGNSAAGLTPTQLGLISSAGLVSFALDINGFLTASPAGPTLAAFNTFNFNQEELGDPDISGPDADPDGDGITNILEYAFASNPRAASRANLPVATTVPITGSTYVACIFTRVKSAIDLTFTAEFSSTPSAASFTASGSTEVSVQDHGNGTETVTLRDNTPVTPATPRFVRLRVDQN